MSDTNRSANGTDDNFGPAPDQLTDVYNLPTSEGITPSPLDGALKMASLGYTIFLLKNYGDGDKRKTPLNSGWQGEATTDPDIIRRRFEQHPNSNYGIKLGPHDVALDYDEISESHFDRLKAWVHNTIGLDGQMQTFIQRTASERGYHELLKLPDGFEIKNNPRLYRRGGTTIELRSSGYYIVGPYSKIGNAVYSPLTSFSVAELTPSQCEKLVAMSNERKRGTRIFEFDLSDKIPNGSRHTTLMALAGSLRHKGLGYESILGMLGIANNINCVEPLPSSELDDIAQFVADKPSEMEFTSISNGEIEIKLREGYGIGTDNIDMDLSTMPTQMGVAEWFAREYHDRIRYCAKWKKWLAFNDTQWWPGADGADVIVQQCIKNKAKEIYRELEEAGQDPEKRCSLDEQKELSTFARRCQQASFISGVLDLAKNEPELQITPEELNADKWLFNVENGTIDLRTRTIHKHRAEDYITYTAPVTYNPDAHSDVFENYLTKVMPNYQDRQSLQQVAFMGMTGQAYEIVIIFYGTGANGKSTFVTALSTTLGPYAKEVNPDILLQTKHEGHPTEKANLYGVRLATTRETNRQQRLDSAKLKDVASTDPISARRMYEDFWEFKPTHLTVMRTNHKPVITSSDIGTWRRLALFPWKVTLPKNEWDLSLGDKLADESTKSAILNWMLEGGSYLKDGKFDFSPNIRTATREYQLDSDVFGQFFDQHYIKDETGRVQAKEIRDLYNEEHSKQPISYNRLSDELFDHGFDRKHTREGVFWSGFRKREANDSDDVSVRGTLLAYDDTDDECDDSTHEDCEDCEDLSEKFVMRDVHENLLDKSAQSSPNLSNGHTRTIITNTNKKINPTGELHEAFKRDFLNMLRTLEGNPSTYSFESQDSFKDFVLSEIHDRTGQPIDTLHRLFAAVDTEHDQEFVTTFEHVYSLCSVRIESDADAEGCSGVSDGEEVSKKHAL